MLRQSQSPPPPPAKPEASLKVISGGMFSGKTEMLIQQVRRFKFSPKSIEVLILKPRRDTRSDGVLSRNTLSESAVAIDETISLMRLLDFDSETRVRLERADVVAIDEAQFFSGLVAFCKQLVYVHHKHVIVAGLTLNSKAESWGEVSQLIPHAHVHMPLTAVCRRCGRESAIYSHCNVHKTENILIGDSEYEALCGHCYVEAISDATFF